MDSQQPTKVDTQGTAPAAPAAPALDTASVVAMAKEQLAAPPAEATPADAPAAEPKEGADTATAPEADKGQPQPGKYKTLEDAEAANREAQRKITELANELKALKEAAAKPALENKPEAKPEEDEDPPLTEEELDALWKEDPAAARAYERANLKRELKKDLAPLAEKVTTLEAEKQRTAEIAAMEKLEASVDEKHGKGTFAEVEKMIADPAELENLVTGSEYADLFRLLMEKGDRVRFAKLVVSEAVAARKARAAEKAARSTPATTGTAAPTAPAARVIKTTADVIAEAKRRAAA